MTRETVIHVCTNTTCKNLGNAERATELKKIFANCIDVRVKCAGCLRGCKTGNVPSINIKHANFNVTKLRGKQADLVIDAIENNTTTN